MRNMAFVNTPAVAIAKHPKKSSTRLYFGDMVIFLSEVCKDFKRKRRRKKK